MDKRDYLLNTTKIKYLKFLFILIICTQSTIAFAQVTPVGTVGINTQDPKASLDIAGNLRIQDVQYSSSTDEFNLVVDDSGYVKKSLIDKSIFRAYLNNNFESGTGDIRAIYRINSDYTVLEDVGEDFNNGSKQFVAPITGYYSIRMTITATMDKQSLPGNASNAVFGLVHNTATSENPSATHEWVLRFSVPISYLTEPSALVGAANSFIGVAKLEAGQAYYFGVTSHLTVIAYPDGSSGKGIGTFFELQLVKKEE